MNDLSHFLRVAGSLNTVPIVFVQLLRNVSGGLSCLDIPAPTSLACPCGPHSFKGTPESLRVFQPSEQEERKVKKKLSNVKKKRKCLNQGANYLPQMISRFPLRDISARALNRHRSLKLMRSPKPGL